MVFVEHQNFLVKTWPYDVKYEIVKRNGNESGHFGCKKYGPGDYTCLCDFKNCNDVNQDYLRLEFAKQNYFIFINSD